VISASKQSQGFCYLQAWFPLCWQQHHWTVLLKDWAKNWAPELVLPAGLILPSWQQHHWNVLLEAQANIKDPELLPTTVFVPLSWQQLLCLLGACAGKYAPGLLLHKGLVPLCLQHYRTALLEPTPGKQAPEISLPTGLVLLCLQQLPKASK
jgi:hypothetical protein